MSKETASTTTFTENQSASVDQGNMFRIVLICIVATIGGFLFGFDSGVINGTVDGIQIAFQSDSAVTGFNVASMLLGCAVGAFMAGRLADQFGRRPLLMISAIMFLLSAWGSGIAPNSVYFVLARVLGGFAVGAASILTPAYISEITPTHVRGRMVAVQQIAILTGLFSAFVSNYVIVRLIGSATELAWWGFEGWRWMFWVEIIPAAAFLLGLFFIPESPRYLVLTKQSDKALTVLQTLFTLDQAKKLVASIETSVDDSNRQPRFSDLIDTRLRQIYPVVWIGIGIAIFQQFVGINVVFYYGAVLWQSVGFSESDALLINIISSLASLFAWIVAMLLIDKIGRKPLLLAGSIGMAITLLGLVIAFSMADLGTDGQLSMSQTLGAFALVAANAYVFFFNMSWGPVMWVMLGEMFPNRMRGMGLAVAGFFQWISNFAITMTFPMLLGSIGLAGAYSFYMTCATLSIFFVWFKVRETKGISLEEMRS